VGVRQQRRHQQPLPRLGVVDVELDLERQPATSAGEDQIG
jgi:hypothetical protein